MIITDDERPALRYDAPVPTTRAAQCTYCMRNAYPAPTEESMERWMVKLHWANRPLGQLVILCPDHHLHWVRHHVAGPA